MSGTTQRRVAIIGLALLAALGAGPQAGAKSLFMISNVDSGFTPLVAYDVQPAPAHLVFQNTLTIPRLAGNPSVLALDSATRTLFVSNDGSPELQIIDAAAMRHRGTVVAGGGLSDIAALAFDSSTSRLFAVQRDTDRLFVYAWDATGRTLTLAGGALRVLPGVAQASALAFDPVNGRLLVGDRGSMVVRMFNAATFADAGTVDLTPGGQTVTALAFDATRNILYAGNADAATGSLGRIVRFDLANRVGSVRALPAPGDDAVSLAVDPDRATLYVTTRLADTLLVYDADLNVVKADLGDLGNPGPVVVPPDAVSYNLMNFELVLDTGRPAVGEQLGFVVCYRNGFEAAVSDVTIVDTLPPGLAFVSATGGGAHANGVVTWSIGLVPSGARACNLLTLRVTGAAGSTQLQSATITASPVAPITQTHVLRITGEAPPPPPAYLPLGFSVDDSVQSVVTGHAATYRVCYDNLANPLPVANAVMVTTLPAGAQLVSATGPYGIEGTQLRWTLGTVAASAPQACHDLVLQLSGEPGSSVTLSVALSSDSTPTQTAEHATPLAAEPVLPPTPVQVDGEGAGGAVAPWQLLAGCALLAAAALRRSRRVLGPLLAVLVAMLGVGAAQAADPPAASGAYVGAGGGGARTDATAAGLDAALAARGYTTAARLDRSDTGWKLFGGWRFNRWLAAELAYVDLGTVSSTIVATVPDTAAFVADVARVHPYSVAGVSLAGVGSVPLGAQVSAFAKVGLFRWDADIEAHLAPAGAPRADSSARGTDWVAGAGLRWAPGRWGVQAEWERFATDRNDVDLWSISVLYMF